MAAANDALLLLRDLAAAMNCWNPAAMLLTVSIMATKSGLLAFMERWWFEVVGGACGCEE